MMVALRIAAYAAMGFLCANLGYGPTSWQLYALLGLMGVVQVSTALER